MTPVAQPITYTAIGGAEALPVPVLVIDTDTGNPVAPTSVAIITPPSNGVATATGAVLTYAPTAGTIATADSFTYTATVGGVTTAPATVTVAIGASYNCACDDEFPTATLADLRKRVLIRLGFGAQLSNPPPGIAPLINDFLQSAQEFLYRKYSLFRTERFFTWQMQAGVRFYDLAANVDACVKKLDPRKVLWMGVSQGDLNWRELIYGIRPSLYTTKQSAIPQYAEIRQCIEVWPAPADNSWLLRIKGNFGLLPLVADTDVTTIDSELVFLWALANAKMDRGQPDAGQVAQQARELLGSYVAGQHPTQRFWPGAQVQPNAVPPKMVP